MNLDDKAATVTDKYKECITIFTKKMVSLHELGLTRADDDLMGNVVSDDDDMLEFASADSHRQVIPEEQERGPSDRDVASKEQERGLFGHDEPSVSGELEQAVSLDAPVVEEPRRVEVEEEGFVVEGVALTSDSSTRTLRAACKSLGIFSSGGKQKLYSRFEAHLEERKIALTREAANEAKEVMHRQYPLWFHLLLKKLNFTN